MGDYYFSIELDGNRALCLAPMTERRAAAADSPIADTSGYFLYERRGSGENADVEVLARVVSREAAFRLRGLLKMD